MHSLTSYSLDQTEMTVAQGLLKTYTLTMEDKMAAGAFGRTRGHNKQVRLFDKKQIFVINILNMTWNKKGYIYNTVYKFYRA